jgi:predicted RNA binding protein YcfA (HicA-like mRNA interferase family)
VLAPRWDFSVETARISSRKLLQVLAKAGFYIHHQTGSHANLRHPIKTHLRLVVPRHSGDLAPKTLKSIIAQAEMTVDEFANLLRR